MVTTLHFSISKGHAIASASLTVEEQTNIFHHVEKVQSILTLFSKTDIKCFNKIFLKTWHRVTSLNSVFEYMIWIFHSLKTDTTKLLKRGYT